MDGAAAVIEPAPPEINKLKVISAAEYKSICNFINHYRGLAIECQLELVNRYPNVHHLTLKSIMQSEHSFKMRTNHWRYKQKSKKMLEMFESKVGSHPAPTLLTKMALAEDMSPAMLCRFLLQEKYDFQNKSELSRIMKYPQLIDDPDLSANVIQCLCSDITDGPLVDLRRRIVGEEYEYKLKKLAKAAGIHYYDEQDLRRMGYDKTPDIKTILPFLYKGEVVNWIESKAMFGDPKTHNRYIQVQLESYSNRFGPGIIIYWFGYQEETPLLPENNVGVTVLDDFPAKEDLTLLEVDTDVDEQTQEIIM